MSEPPVEEISWRFGVLAKCYTTCINVNDNKNQLAILNEHKQRKELKQTFTHMHVCKKTRQGT